MEIIYLCLSLVALAAGPLLWSLLATVDSVPTRRRLLSGVDVVVLLSITWLIVAEVLPEALGRAGYGVLLFFTIGLLLPLVLEQVFRRLAREMHIAALVLAVAGILLHTLVDGTLLTGEHHAHLASPQSHSDSLALAVVIHRLPVALALWWLIYPALGLRWAVPVLGLMGVATVSGFLLSSGIAVVHEITAMAPLQALVAGMILHAVYNRPHLEHAHPAPAPVPEAEPALAGAEED